MRILITGATGFIGKHLVNYLQKKNIDITINLQPNELNPFNDLVKAITIDINNPQKVLNDFSEQKFDGIIHLATFYVKDHKIADISQMIEANIKFGTIILDCAVQTNIKWFINTGTFWQHYNNSDYSPVNLYAATKQAFEGIIKYYSENKMIDVKTLKLCDTYGPDDTRPKVFNLWKKYADTGEVLNMSAGEQLIDILHVDDIVDGFYILSILLNEKSILIKNDDCFVLKANKRYTLKQLSEIFEESINKKINIEWGKLPYRKREVMEPYEKGIILPNWEQKIDLLDGIRTLF